VGYFVLVNLPPSIIIPSSAPPADNAYGELLQIARLAARLKHQSPLSSHVSLTPIQERAETEACAAEAAPLIIHLRALLLRPIVALPVRTFKQSLVFPSSFMRTLSRVIRTCADNELQDGRPAESMEIRLDGLEIMTAATQGQNYDSLLTLIACEAILQDGFESQIPMLSGPQLTHVAERMEKIRFRRVPFADIIQEEGYAQTAQFQEILDQSGKGGLRNYASARGLVAGSEDNSLTWSERKQLAAYLLSSKEQMLKDNLDYFTQIAAELRKPNGSRKQIKLPENLLAFYEVGMFGLGSRAENRAEAIFEILRTEIAIRRYQLAKGDFPTELKQLCTVYLPSPPLDPSGRTGTELLRYVRLNNNRYILYAEDPNRQAEVNHPPDIPQPGDLVAGRLFKH
jgi:hypothetical protein